MSGSTALTARSSTAARLLRMFSPCSAHASRQRPSDLPRVVRGGRGAGARQRRARATDGRASAGARIPTPLRRRAELDRAVLEGRGHAIRDWARGHRLRPQSGNDGGGERDHPRGGSRAIVGIPRRDAGRPAGLTTWNRRWVAALSGGALQDVGQSGACGESDGARLSQCEPPAIEISIAITTKPDRFGMKRSGSEGAAEQRVRFVDCTHRDTGKRDRVNSIPERGVLSWDVLLRRTYRDAQRAPRRRRLASGTPALGRPSSPRRTAAAGPRCRRSCRAATDRCRPARGS